MLHLTPQYSKYEVVFYDGNKRPAQMFPWIVMVKFRQCPGMWEWSVSPLTDWPPNLPCDAHVAVAMASCSNVSQCSFASWLVGFTQSCLLTLTVLLCVSLCVQTGKVSVLTLLCTELIVTDGEWRSCGRITDTRGSDEDDGDQWQDASFHHRGNFLRWKFSIQGLRSRMYLHNTPKCTKSLGFYPLFGLWL